MWDQDSFICVEFWNILGSRNIFNMHPEVADPGGRGGHAPPGPVKLSNKMMVAEGGRIDFMFLAHSPTRPLDPLPSRMHNVD